LGTDSVTRARPLLLHGKPAADDDDAN